MAVTRKTLDHPVLTLMVFVLMSIMGFSTVQNIAISLFPNMEIPYVMVMTTYRNSNPESVERSVTKPIESALVSVSGLKNITSTSSESVSTVVLEFEYGTNLDVAINDVRDKLERAKRVLPDNADSPSIMIMDTNAIPIMRISISGNRPTDDLREMAEDTISGIIEQANGVAEASVNGGRDKIVRVDVSENRLAAYGLTITAVSSALARQNLDLSGGKITEGTINYSIRTSGEYMNVEEISNAVISSVGGRIIRLSDVGVATLSSDDQTSIVYINGEPGVYLSITKQSGANSVTVADNVYAKIEQLRKTLPSDISLEIIQDDTTVIRDTIDVLMSSLAQGLGLAVIILFIFLQNFKSTFIIAISIPISMVITVMCMYFAGLTFNMITLTGLILGLGMIVDASVVMIENIYVYRSRGAKAKISAVLGSSEMLMSVVSGNLTTICVFLPFIFYIKELGMMGQMFQELIFTIVIALLSSLFVAIFLVPVMAGKFMPLTNRNEKPVRNPLLKFLYGFFQKIIEIITAGYKVALRAALNHRLVTVILSFSILVFSFVLIPTLRIALMGDVSEESVTVNIRMPIGTELSKTNDVVQRFERVVRDEIKGYTTITSSVGGGGRNASSYTGSIVIRIPSLSKDQIDNSADIQRKLREHFADFSEANMSFAASSSRQMSGSSDIQIEVRSDDLDAALEVSESIETLMKDIADLGDISVDTTRGLPQVEVIIDRDRAAAFGVDVATVATEISYAMNGVTSTQFHSNGKEYDVKVWYRPEDRSKMSDLSQIYVRGTSGMVSVENFASLRRGVGPVSIRRTNQTRIVKVSANIITETNANIVEERIEKAISDSLVIPENVTITYAGSWSDVSKQAKIYGKLALLAIILVFGVMAGTYESFKAPFINLMTIPFLAIGVVLIFKFTGQVLSMTAMVGVIMLIGIVVNNGIILVDQTSLLIERGYKMKDACLDAGVSRLRPVLMTTLTTIIGMLPMALQKEGSAAFVQPIALAIVGGLTASTFVTLFFVPVMYSLIMREKKHNYVELPSEVLALTGENLPAAKGRDIQISIIANQSVQEDIIEVLEQVMSDIKYAIVSPVTGKGKEDYKLGNTTWPEINFMLITYLDQEHLELIQTSVAYLKKRFPREGIKMFVVGNEQ